MVPCSVLVPAEVHSKEILQTSLSARQALSAVQCKGLMEVQRQLERAYEMQSHDLVERAARQAHSLGLPLGTGGLLPPLMPESVCFPKGSRPEKAEAFEGVFEAF